MHPAIKILIGALMVVVGVYTSATFWQDLLGLIQAGIGPLLVLIGAFLVWLESDEWKMRREKRSESQGLQQFDAAESETSEENETDQDKSEENEGYTCGECGKTFDTERGLHIHQAQKHE